MQNKFVPVALWPLGLGMAVMAANVHAEALASQTVTGIHWIDGSIAERQAGATALYRNGSGSRFYGDAETGRLALNATTLSGSAPHNAQSLLSYHGILTNETSQALSYAFNFTWNAGKLEAVGGGAFNSADGAATASLNGLVRVDNTELWQTSAECNAQTCTRSGIDVGYLEHTSTVGKSYEFGRYDGSVSVGVLRPGQSVNIEYSMLASSSSIGLGVGYAEVGPYSAFVTNDFSGLGGVSVTASPIPEPQQLLLLSAGFALIAVRSRRRRSE